MKKAFGRSLTVLLAVLTMLSAFAVVGAYAAETDSKTVAAAVESEEVAAPAESEEVAAPAESAKVAAPAKTESAKTSSGTKVTVGKVTSIEKTTFNVNSIGLKWKKVSGATGYAIYLRDVDKTVNYHKIADVTTSASYTIKGLPQASNTAIKIAAYKIVGGKRYEGEGTVKRTGTQPSTPTGLTRVACGNRIEIKWNGNSRATGYKVYRACGATGFNYVYYKTVTSPKLVDKNTKGGNTYIYKINAYRKLSNGCTYTSCGNSISAMRGLTTPSISTSSKLYRVTLSWSKNKYANSYGIYYSKTSTSGHCYLGSTSGTSFTTKKLPEGKLYFYVYPLYVTNKRTVTGTTVTKAGNVSDKIYGQSAGSTYVEVSISQQRMWFYKNNKLMVDTPVVTGNKGTNDTPKGFFYMYQRARNTTLVGPGYASPVDYWMAFWDGCGLHDASWRDEFGGNIYNGNGSHGCVNTPYNAVRTIYNNTDYDTPVIVY